MGLITLVLLIAGSLAEWKHAADQARKGVIALQVSMSAWHA